MEIEERLRILELANQRQGDKLDGHERECTLRYKGILDGNERIEANVKYLAFAVAALALVVLGVATVQDLVRSGAGRVGVSIQQPAP